MTRNPWDDDIDILSAENVSFAIETAGLGSRFGAAIIDLLLQFATLGLGAIAVNYLIDFLPPLDQVSQWVRAFLMAIGALLVALISVGYSFFFEWLWDGQTPGKRWLGLRVMQSNGMPIGAWHAMIRSLMRAADFLPFMYGAGAFVALVSSRNQRIGDMVAGTVVARERHDAARAILDIDSAADAFLASLHAPVQQTQAPVMPSTAMPDSTVLSAPQPLQHAAVATHPQLSDGDRDLLREYFARRGQLTPAARTKLAQGLATRLAAKLGVPLDTDAESWLETLARGAFTETS
ncbi:MAG TPA: RDD family protein [Abditibacteriaceae bacterium]|jgi:uncharacterized RDD family membrane protein YckC